MYQKNNSSWVLRASGADAPFPFWVPRALQVSPAWPGHQVLAKKIITKKVKQIKNLLPVQSVSLPTKHDYKVVLSPS